MTFRRFSLAICFVLSLSTRVSSSRAANIDFSVEDDFVTPLLNGQMIDTEFGNLFTVSASGHNAGAAIFDTTPGVNAADPDLWVNLGNAMILQSNSGSDDDNDGSFFFNPNDDSDLNGFLTFDFITAVEMVSLDLIDVNGNGPATVVLTDKNGLTRTYDIPFHWTFDINSNGLPPTAKGYETLDLTTLLPQIGEGGGIATASEMAGFDPTSIIQLQLEFDGSHAVDNLVFIPEPATLGFMALAGLSMLRRKRR